MSTYKRLSFTNEDEKKLIDAIKQHPALWDPTSVEYGNVSLRKYYWKSISHQMKKNGRLFVYCGEIAAKYCQIQMFVLSLNFHNHFPASECRRKWRFVRDYYVLKRKRVSNAPDSKYANLSFLDKIVRPKFIKPVDDNDENDEVLDYQDEESPMVDELEDHLIDDIHPNSAVGSTTDTRENVFVTNDASRSSENENMTEYLSVEKYTEDDNQETEHSTQRSEFYDIDENTSDKFTIMKTIQHEDKVTTEIVQPVVTRVNRTIQERDIDLFFQSMASTVKTFPSHLVAKAKMKVFSAINELETQLHEK